MKVVAQLARKPVASNTNVKERNSKNCDDKTMIHNRPLNQLVRLFSYLDYNIAAEAAGAVDFATF